MSLPLKLNEGKCRPLSVSISQPSPSETPQWDGLASHVLKGAQQAAHACAADKLKACESGIAHSRRMSTFMVGSEKRGKPGQEQQLQKICRDTNKAANEQIKGVSAQVQPNNLRRIRTPQDFVTGQWQAHFSSTIHARLMRNQIQLPPPMGRRCILAPASFVCHIHAMKAGMSHSAPVCSLLRRCCSMVCQLWQAMGSSSRRRLQKRRRSQWRAENQAICLFRCS